MRKNGKLTPEMSALMLRTGMGEAQIRRVMRALAMEIRRNRRTEIRGLGVFTWRLFRGTTPKGAKFKTARLWFHSSGLKFRGRKKELLP